ncbi:MAG: amino acid permease [Cyanobacteria bacterium SIG30]|nr:amino acid permease [Cyanobacteria bacterium SIG30]
MNNIQESEATQQISADELKGLNNFVKNIFKIKNPDEMIKTANQAGLKKTLGAFDLIVLGVGAIIGSGIFTVIGLATVGDSSTLGAGPGLVVSMILASLACVFSALCYSEFASMIPVAGSAYLYTYATMGEFFAWIIGWAVTLEYLVGYIAVSFAWTGYLMQFLKGFEKILPAFITNPPAYLIGNEPIITLANGNMPILLNVPAIIATIVICMILIKGIQESTKMTAIMVAIKLLVIGLFIVAGAFYVKPENWTPFAPNGIEGIISGAFIIFFAYIGFDAIATAAEETKNPQKNLPIGIIGSLAVCTVVYILVELVLTGIMPLNAIDVKAPIAYAMNHVGQNWFAGFISVGALAGLTSVLLVLMLAGSRVLYAMSRDGFLPKSLQMVHKKFQTPYAITIGIAAVVIAGSFFIDINMAADLCVYGTFTSFIIVCVAVLILRKTDPERHRPFKVPFSPLFPSLGVVCCGGLMGYYTFLKLTNVKENIMSTSPMLFLVWVLTGIMIYFTYSYKQKRKLEAQDNNE